MFTFQDTKLDGVSVVVDPIISVEGAVKAFPGGVRALDGLDLTVGPGIVYGLLGPNGAGKTTLIRVLATLLRPDAGHVRIAGIDVRRDPEAVRTRIGLAGQYAAVDDYLTGRENVEMVGRLYGLSRREARQRATDTLDRIHLADAADRQVKTYSGGMRRRIDLAASLVGRPQVLFLDEPTTGVDPASRRDLWDLIEDLVDDGTTVMLTTQYLDEADRLAHRIGVIDHGQLVSEGTADELKDRVGEAVVQLSIPDTQLTAATVALQALSPQPARQERQRATLILHATDGVATLRDALRRLDAADITPTDVGLHKPTLDDVFLALTRHRSAGDTRHPTAA
jgi:daunorubicin resistance ABC transporter ATP-binding subunit